jgi:tetratricopeptide (TPR) repeat protein
MIEAEPGASGQDQDALVARAEAAARDGEPWAARTAYEAALRGLERSQPLRVRALAGLGWTLRVLGDARTALRQHEEAIAVQRGINPRDQDMIAVLRSGRADALMALDRCDEALNEYEMILEAGTKSDQFRAATLNLAGEAAARAGHHDRAAGHQAAAVALLRTLLPPGDKQLGLALANLGASLLHVDRLDAAEAVLREALRIGPDLLVATGNLVQLLNRSGREAEGRALADATYERQKRGFTVQQPVPPDPAGTLLTLWSLEGNIPCQHLLRRLPLRVIEWHVEFSGPDQELPQHDLVLNLVGDADGGAAALAQAATFQQRCAVPLLNDPARVLRTRRDLIGDTLHGIDAVVVPRAVRVAGTALRDGAVLKAHGLRLPVLLREAGRHGGESVQRIATPEDLERAAAELQADAVYVTDYHDYASADGLHRKYRVIFVDRVPLPYHLAISRHWLVHYFSAEMEHADRLAEEQRFLADMPAALGPDAVAALRDVARRLDLDYCGADFSLLPDGRVLLFESNATMLVHPEQPGTPFADKAPYIDHIFHAFDTMIMRHIAEHRQAR